MKRQNGSGVENTAVHRINGPRNVFEAPERKMLGNKRGKKRQKAEEEIKSEKRKRKGMKGQKM